MSGVFFVGELGELGNLGKLGEWDIRIGFCLCFRLWSGAKNKNAEKK